MCRRFRLDLQALVVAAAVATACGVDDRQLSGAEASSGAAGSAGDDDGRGPAPNGNDGGAGSGGDMPDGLVDGCADLDTDKVADCRVNLLENGTFASDVKGWEPSAGELRWDPKNALADLSSGSARLRSTGSNASASQCVVVSDGSLVIAYANVYVATADGDEDPPAAELEVSFFDAKDCSGTPNHRFETPPSASVDEWLVVQAGQVTNSTTRSVSLSLLGWRTQGSGLDVYFDNVMLKVQDL